MPWQPAPITFPDIELVLATKMRAALVAAGQSTVYVSRDVPKPRRPRMVLFNRDGGSAETLDRPRVRCRVWDVTDKAANDLARLVESLIQTVVDGDPVTRVVKESGPYEVPDDSESAQRYLLFTLYTRGASA